MSLSWYQLFAGQYDAVIQTTRQAAAINPNYIEIDTNRAHALMFKGSANEAREVYVRHKGKKVGNNSWEEVILDDFAQLERANIKNPLMEEIRRHFKS